ncbi:MAG: hypothetical protein HY207_08060 [Nitrospirae bacterium]|nr:hypothetical protein [Nitrospirota bacterium]
MRWRKLGHVYVPGGEDWWARSYALLPTVEVRSDRVLRIYFASLDDQQYGRIGWVDVESADPRRIVGIARMPVLDLGELGGFDDSGVNPSCLITVDGRRHLYYIGWQRCARVPYMLFTGLALGQPDGESFDRLARTPVLDRTPQEPFSRSAPIVLVEGTTMKMWYWSCVKWTVRDGRVHYNNVIRYATSLDGVNWIAYPQTCVEPDFIDEYSVGRPCVMRDGGLYRMWYSVRSFSARYRIGYAESADGMHWVRKDGDAGIERSDHGWDSEMICYPFVMDAAGRRYLFYNGNHHGKTGFGCAVLDG